MEHGDAGVVGSSRALLDGAPDQVDFFAADEFVASHASCGIEEANPVEEFAPERHVAAPDLRPAAQGGREQTALFVVHQTKAHEKKAIANNPPRRRRLPAKEDAPPHAISVPLGEGRQNRCEPIRRRQGIVFGESDELTASFTDPAIACMADTLLRLEHVAYRNGSAFGKRRDDLFGVIIGVIVDDEDFPVHAVGNLLGSESGQRICQ